MNRIKKILIPLFAVAGVCFCGAASAQRTSVKINALHAASATPNLAFETALGSKTTLDLYGGYNWFDWKDNKKWKHWIVQPELRWWFCERFNGSFVGVHLHGGEFNVGGVGPFTTIKNHRYEGYFYGLGVSYGHQWILGRRWAFEMEIGAGYTRVEYDKFNCYECSPKIKSGGTNYFGPTKIQASLIFFLW